MTDNQTCVHCGEPLADNQVVKDAYRLNTTAIWAKGQLNILADMADARGLTWVAAEARKIANELRTLARKHRKQYLVWDNTVQEWVVCSWNEVRGKFEPPTCNIELLGDAPYRELPEPPFNSEKGE